MNALVQVPQNFGAVSTRFANAQGTDDLGAGISGGFGHIGYKGKVWSIRHRGEERVLMRPDGDGPRNSVEVVVLKASQAVSKIFYENGYTEGSTAAPDCFSSNGLTPDASSVKKQAPACAGCPMNAWITKPDGKKGKRCTDSKRLAVAPLADIKNEMFGGPMLLRVPAASLSDLKKYGDTMNQAGYPYFAVGSRISFDSNEAYPKFVFAGIRPLTDAEADLVLALRDGPDVARILAETQDAGTAQVAAPQPAQGVFEQVSQQLAPAPASASAPKPAPVQAGGFGATVPQTHQGDIGVEEGTTNTGHVPEAATGVQDFDDALNKLLGS